MARGSKGPKVVWPGFNYKPPTRHIVKVGRNDPCPCGSGAKYKDCHEAEGTAFLERIARERHKQAVRAHRQSLKDAGVPWYRRLFS
jgi:hypothetical protein